MATNPPQRIAAPPLEPNLGWLNTDRPIDLASLRGKVVILDFWTYCCINCHHVLPDLAWLERKWPAELVVIGVHTAKFTNERDLDHVRQAVLRHEIEHPVVLDDNFAIWRRYGVRGWPTLWVIDPEGCLVGQVSGEGNRMLLDRAIGELVAHYEPRLALDREPPRFRLEREKEAATALRFPGKVLAAPGGRLVVADTGHHRIVVARTDGTVDAVVGTGEPGLADGPWDRATFRNPQGLALEGDLLYVADTENHAIRRIDLRARTVETIAGTGRQARVPNSEGRGVDLNSPWDLALADGTLFVAMAGPHQIWKLDLATLKASVHAGSGREARIDGPHKQSAFAQPSGIVRAGPHLFVADSEISAVRRVDVAPEGRTDTIVGLDLFEFGDVDGKGEAVRLQHALGIEAYEGKLYVADTYNHKVKEIDPRTRESRTLAGTGVAGAADAKGRAAAFYEPGGVSALGGKLYVADTNNHRVRVVDLGTLEVATLPFPALRPPARPGEVLAVSGSERGADEETAETSAPEGTDFLLPQAREIALAPAKIAPSAANMWQVRFDLPDGCHANEQAPVVYRYSIEGDALAVPGADETHKVSAAKLPILEPLGAVAGGGPATLRLAANVPYCADRSGMCFMASVVVTQTIEVVEGGPDWLNWNVAIEP